MAPWAIRLISYGLWVMRWLVDSILEWRSLKWKDKEIELITAICLLCLSREILETETHWFPAALWHPVALETRSGNSLKPHLSLSWQQHMSFIFFAAKSFCYSVLWSWFPINIFKTIYIYLFIIFIILFFIIRFSENIFFIKFIFLSILSDVFPLL